MSEEDFLSFVENMNFKGKYFCVFNQYDIYDDGSETPALEQEILAEYLYFFEFDDDSLDKYEMLKYRQIGKKFCVLDKEQFLRYEDDCYFKKTPDFLEMRSFLRNETGLSKRGRRRLCERYYDLFCNSTRQFRRICIRSNPGKRNLQP